MFREQLGYGVDDTLGWVILVLHQALRAGDLFRSHAGRRLAVATFFGWVG